jgi:hypothetical protein
VAGIAAEAEVNELMNTKSSFTENPLFVPENYTCVSAETLQNIFPPKPTPGDVEYPVESAPERTPAERGALKKSIFFRQK